jgi:tetratricopeptide (TPR) repeat protein
VAGDIVEWPYDADVRNFIGTVHRLTGRPDLAVAASTRAVAASEQGPPERRPAVLIGLAAALLAAGDAPAAAAEADRALQLARHAALRLEECRALFLLSVIHHRLGRRAQSLRCLEQARVIADETGFVPPAHEASPVLVRRP